MTPVNFSRELAVRDDAFWRIMDVIVPYPHTEYSDILPGCPGCAGGPKDCAWTVLVSYFTHQSHVLSDLVFFFQYRQNTLPGGRALSP